MWFLCLYMLAENLHKIHTIVKSIVNFSVCPHVPLNFCFKRVRAWLKGACVRSIKTTLTPQGGNIDKVSKQCSFRKPPSFRCLCLCRSVKLGVLVFWSSIKEKRVPGRSIKQSHNALQVCVYCVKRPISTSNGQVNYSSQGSNCCVRRQM